MTDKLMKCPCCDSKLVLVDNGIRACLNMRCEIHSFIINDKVCKAYHKKITVLQKKLDKAMHIINNTRDIFIGCGGTGTAKTIERAIKEIADIKVE